MKQNNVLQFMNYKPIIYSGFDKFNIKQGAELANKGYTTIFIYYDTLDNTPSMYKDILETGSKVDFIDSSKNKLHLFIQVFKLYLKYKPILVHVHFIELIKVYTALCSLILRVPLISSYHSVLSLYNASNYKKVKGFLKFNAFRFYLNLMAFSSKYCFCVSEDVRQQYIDFIGDNKKIETLYLGVAGPTTTKDKTQIRAQLNLPTDTVLLCNVSAIEHIKGLDVIIDGILILKNKYNLDNFMFCHIGGLRSGEASDAYSDNLKRIVNENNLDNCFKWMGPRFDIMDVLPAFDIYLQPSRTEGIPVSVMEACAAGLPCIGTNVGGIPEAIHNEKNGFVISSGSAEELAEKMFDLITDEKKRMQMGIASKQIFNEDFNIDIQVQKTIDHYIN